MTTEYSHNKRNLSYLFLQVALKTAMDSLHDKVPELLPQQSKSIRNTLRYQIK